MISGCSRTSVTFYRWSAGISAGALAFRSCARNLVVRSAVSCFLVTASFGAHAELVAIDEAALEEVTGQAGIAVEFRLDMNTDSNGTPLAGLSSCSGLSNPCRLAIEFANRTDQWLVFKDFYGNLVIDTLFLDGGHLSDAGHSTGYFDVTKFQGDGGVCLIPGGCTTGNISSMAALKLSYPSVASSYTPGTGVSTGYSSYQLGLTLGRIAVEFGTTAYNGDANGSFMGVKVADNNGVLAGADIRGTAYVFGF